jgi:hypothetical protein
LGRGEREVGSQVHFDGFFTCAQWMSAMLK